MENSQEDFVPKPIDKVNESLYAIKTQINKINVDVVCIKADLEFIKHELLKEKPKSTPVKGGWIFS
tara:strand:- start:130 stop:327 length:198 start_codon:yes stop_codon:yes gene_type:complete